MRLRLLLNLFLFLTVIGLIMFLSRPTNDVEDHDVLLTTTDPASIKNIKIIRRDLGKILFSKQDNEWRMLQPNDIAANELRINTMLNLLQAYSYTQLDSNMVELQQFMLDDPVVAIEFDDAKISFGDTSPLEEGKLRYVLHNDTVHLINDSLYQQLLTNASFFISPKLLPKNDSIVAIQFPEHRIQRDNSIWKIIPDKDISADQIISIINAWQEAEAITVRKYIEQDQEASIIVDMEQSQPIEFKIAAPLPNLVLARPELSVQYHISSVEANKLFPQDQTVIEQTDIPAEATDN